jgi:hypothetical protein
LENWIGFERTEEYLNMFKRRIRSEYEAMQGKNEPVQNYRQSASLQPGAGTPKDPRRNQAPATVTLVFQDAIEHEGVAGSNPAEEEHR